MRTLTLLALVALALFPTGCQSLFQHGGEARHLLVAEHAVAELVPRLPDDDRAREAVALVAEHLDAWQSAVQSGRPYGARAAFAVSLGQLARYTDPALASSAPRPPWAQALLPPDRAPRSESLAGVLQVIAALDAAVGVGHRLTRLWQDAQDGVSLAELEQAAAARRAAVEGYLDAQ